MGVPAFYRWLSQRYAKAIIPAILDEPENVDGIAIPGATVEYSKPNPNGELDNLYLDMNGIVHPCTHPEGRPAPTTEDEMMLEVFRYTDRVLSLAKPRKVLVMAVDGVAPRAKMNQQRSRRFRSAQDATIAQEEEDRKARAAASIGAELDAAIKDPAQRKWDTNVITPGTPFMDYLARSLRYWVAYKLNTEPGWKDLKVIISDASVPGEGEHKIMEYIRSQRNSPYYDPNTSHCIYGLDADLIFLGLATHEPNFRILREDVFNQNKSAGKEKGHIWLDVGILRQYLEIELSCEVDFWDVERAIDDWIFMAFFCGNDFLPHLPSLDVRENGLDILLRSWRSVLPRMGGFMTKDGDVLLARVQTMLKGVANEEDNIFKKRHDIELRREASRKQQQLAKKMRTSNYIDRHPAAPVQDIQLYSADGSEVSNAPTTELSSAGNPLAPAGSEDQLVRDRPASERPPASARTVSAGSKRGHPEEPPNAADDDVDDEVKLWQDGYHDRYYESKLHIDPNAEPEFVREMVFKYIEGVCWVLKYYYQGCPSWTWFYPYHYAPFAKDLVDQNLSTFTIEFPQDTIPFLPFEQLMSVLPAASSHTLPKVFRHLMSDPDSPIIDFYPVDFPIDMNGKKMAWQGIALLPFIDEKRLLEETRKKYAELSEAELSRNTRNEPILLVSPHSPVKAKLMTLYDDYATPKITEVFVNDRESKGLSGTMKRAPEYQPNQPLTVPSQSPNSESEFPTISNDQSVTVQYHMPDNQSHKSMLVPGYTEPALVLGPSDIDAIWHRRKRSDRGDDRPDYRKRDLIEFKEHRPKMEGGYLAYLDYQKSNDYYTNAPQQYGSYQGYQGHQGYQGRQANQGYQGQQGYQGYQGYRGYQGHGYQAGQGYQGHPHQGYQSQGYQGNQGYQGYQGHPHQGYQSQGYQGNQGYQGYQGYQGHPGQRNNVSYRDSRGPGGFNQARR